MRRLVRQTLLFVVLIYFGAAVVTPLECETWDPCDAFVMMGRWEYLLGLKTSEEFGPYPNTNFQLYPRDEHGQIIWPEEERIIGNEERDQ